MDPRQARNESTKSTHEEQTRQLGCFSLKSLDRGQVTPLFGTYTWYIGPHLAPSRRDTNEHRAIELLQSQRPKANRPSLCSLYLVNLYFTPYVWPNPAFQSYVCKRMKKVINLAPCIQNIITSHQISSFSFLKSIL